MQESQDDCFHWVYRRIKIPIRHHSRGKSVMNRDIWSEVTESKATYGEQRISLYTWKLHFIHRYIFHRGL
jgi:hypothetical protein